MVMTDVSGTRGDCLFLVTFVIVIYLFIDRATALGHLSVAYGLGMIIGPTLGGWLTRFYNEQFADGNAAGCHYERDPVILLYN